MAAGVEQVRRVGGAVVVEVVAHYARALPHRAGVTERVVVDVTTVRDRLVRAWPFAVRADASDRAFGLSAGRRLDARVRRPAGASKSSLRREPYL